MSSAYDGIMKDFTCHASVTYRCREDARIQEKPMTKCEHQAQTVEPFKRRNALKLEAGSVADNLICHETHSDN